MLVHRYPAAIKAFYMKPDPERADLALGVDMLAPEGYGEIIGGGERLADLDLLLQRIKGWPKALPATTTDSGHALFALGPWGVLINAGAVLYGLAMAVNLAWPRAAVYNPLGGAGYLQGSAQVGHCLWTVGVAAETTPR